MKKFIIIFAMIPILLSSCTRDPYADFIVTKRVVEVGETVYFTNRSIDAYDYEWDFHDGYYSSNFNASHYWDEPGHYTVILTAFGKDGKYDIAQMTIEVLAPETCDLVVTVEEYYEPYYLVAGASVRIYPTVTDWENETNMIVEGTTDDNGEVYFANVPIPFNKRVYVDVWGPNHDNYDLAADDAGFIETGLLTANAVNYFTALVDYYPDGKKAAMSTIDLKKYRKEHNEIKRLPRNK